MKMIKRISAFLLMLMVCFNVVSMPVMAATVTQDGLEVSLTTDKEEYSEGEEILLSITVKNTNQDEVTSIALVDIVSDGYELDEEYVESLKQIGTLAGGDEVSFSVKATAKEDSNNNQNQNTIQNGGGTEDKGIQNGGAATVSSPKTGDSNSVGNWIAACVVLFVGMAAITTVKNKKGKEMLSLFLCGAMILSTFVGASLPVSAVEKTKTITVEETVKYAGEDVTFQAEFSYVYTVEETPEENTDTSEIPENPEVPETPETQDTLEKPETPETPDTPEEPETPVTPDTPEEPETPETPDTPEEPETPVTPDTPEEPETPVTPENPEEPVEEYTLIWEDQFEGTELNREDWNVELHEPGWVNNELQEYVDSTDNIYVKDGNLILQAVRSVDEEGNISYTSGRVNTQNKQDYKYGKFEARIKVPSGQGFLPAFWMMPTDESFYGQWPKCGEIDICEVLGSDTDKTYGTIHFGEPHSEKQGSYTLTEGNFASDFHVFAVEWEPGEIRWYVDGELFHTANDWFTKREGFDEVAYPAPFDQPFYMILNLAVGGNWPGNPDETTAFGENAQLVVDYVKVYQKDSYDENVTKPEATLKDPDASGNYVVNGDFSVAEDLTAAEDWQFLLAQGGEGAATISDGKMVITSTATGTQNHSVQLVQANIPIEQGWRYKISFDAYADAERTMIVDISAPDVSWIRYFADTIVNLTTTSQTFSYTFDMLNETDGNGRVEFNLGNQPSTATVYIDNVRVEKVEQIEIAEEEKTVLPDGNYVYNGAFDQGDNRLQYWEVVNNAGAEYCVTNVDNVREFKVTVPSTVTNLSDVILKQTGLSLSGGKEYLLSFDAYADGDKTIQTQIAGQTFESALTTTKTTYRYNLNTAADATNFDLNILLGTAGTIYLDNVRIQEEGMLINGDFSNGTTGFEVYAYDTNDVDYWVDELNEAGAFTIQIADTGDQDWHIQLKQSNVTLENGKWYKISLDAKSTLDRTIMYALQKDGTTDNDWTPYSGTEKINLTSNFTTFEHTFQMTYDTDEATILSISMGAVNGTQITDQHTVVIDNIKLEETTAPVQEEVTYPAVGTELITNGDFANGSEGWNIYSITAPGAATTDFTSGNAVYNITNVGEQNWQVQLKQEGLKIRPGSTYVVKFDITSTEARTVDYGFLDSANGWVDCGNGVTLEKDVTKSETWEITVPADKTDVSVLYFSMGKISGVDTPVSTITIDNVSIVEKSADNSSESGDGNENGDSSATNTNILTNGDFSDGTNGWQTNIYTDQENGPEGTVSVSGSDAAVVYELTDVGSQNWHVQLKQTDLTIENGATYLVTFDITSTAERLVEYGFYSSTDAYCGGASVSLAANEKQTVSQSITATGDGVNFTISMGLMFDWSTGQAVAIPTAASTIIIDNISIVKQ